MTSIDPLHDAGEAAHHPRRGRGWTYFSALAIFSGTLFLRLILIGGPPYTDEGVYHFSAQVAPASARPTSPSAIDLYPSLVSWIGASSSAPLLRLRLVDGVVAAGTAVMLFLFLSRWTEPFIGFVIASGWSIASNLPLFVDTGFKNAIMAATMAYLGALWSLSSRSRFGPFWAGLLITAAVFMREAFFAIPIVSLYLTAMLHGRRGIMSHVAGMAVAGSILLIWLSIFHGPLDGILTHYLRDMPYFFRGVRSLGRDPGKERWESLGTILRATLWFFPPVILGIGWLLAPGRSERVAKGLSLLLFLPPLYEISTKLCLPYHWAQLLLGVAFLGAMGLRWLCAIDRTASRWPTIAGFAMIAGLVGELDGRLNGRTVHQAYKIGYRSSRECAPVMIWGRWDDACVESSMYLTLAKCIREMTTENDRIVVSGAGHVLFPLTHRLPPSLATADMTIMSLMDYSKRRPEDIEFLRQHPPRLVLETFFHPVVLTDYWPDFEKRYRLVRTFPQDDRKSYGDRGGRIWVLKD